MLYNRPVASFLAPPEDDGSDLEISRSIARGYAPPFALGLSFAVVVGFLSLPIDGTLGMANGATIKSGGGGAIVLLIMLVLLLLALMLVTRAAFALLRARTAYALTLGLLFLDGIGLVWLLSGR